MQRPRSCARVPRVRFRDRVSVSLESVSVTASVSVPVPVSIPCLPRAPPPPPTGHCNTEATVITTARPIADRPPSGRAPQSSLGRYCG